MKQSQIAVHETGLKYQELKDVSVPILQNGQILVKNIYCTLCRSDLNTFIGKRDEKSPTILGHEIVGIIEEIAGDNEIVDERGEILKPGDRITWAIFASDPSGEMAQKGIPQKGSDLFKYGHELLTEASTLHGGLAEYTVLRKHTPIVKLADQVPDQIAAIINCAVATVSGAIRLAGNLKEKVVAVSGTGMLGTIACAMAKSEGAKQVIGLDVNDARLEEVKKFGADQTFNVTGDWKAELAQGFGSENPVDVAMDFSGANAAMEDSLKILAIAGTAVWVGGTFPQQDLHINAEHLIRNLLTIKGLHNYNHADLVHAVEFIEEHHHEYPFSDMIYNIDGLENVNLAFEHAINANPFRVGISIS